MTNELLNDEAPDISMYQVTPSSKKQTRSKRTSMPSTKIMGANHPIEFAKDIVETLNDINFKPGQKHISRGELVEIAFYHLRKELSGKEIPAWIEDLKL